MKKLYISPVTMVISGITENMLAGSNGVNDSGNNEGDIRAKEGMLDDEETNVWGVSQKSSDVWERVGNSLWDD